MCVSIIFFMGLIFALSEQTW